MAWLFFFLVLFLLQSYLSHAGEYVFSAAPPPPVGCCTTGSFSLPATVIFIAVFVSLTIFFVVLRFFCHPGANPSINTTTSAPESAKGGLEKAIIDSFPVMLYAEVKELKLGRGTPECAVCLCELEDADTLRLLPDCSHAFHPDCIDMWLDSHTTCPVCRANLAAAGVRPAHVAVGMKEGGRRGWTPAESERFTLRLPLSLREELMGRRLERSATEGYSYSTRGWRVSTGLSSFKVHGRREWAVKSDRYALLGRVWSLHSPERGGGRGGVAAFPGESSTAGSHRLQ